MRVWTTGIAAMVVVWLTAATVATQSGRPSRQTGALKGRVVSASPVAGAKVYLVPVSAIDTTASAANIRPPSARHRRTAQIASMKNGRAAVWYRNIELKNR